MLTVFEEPGRVFKFPARAQGRLASESPLHGGHQHRRVDPRYAGTGQSKRRDSPTAHSASCPPRPDPLYSRASQVWALLRPPANSLADRRHHDVYEPHSSVFNNLASEGAHPAATVPACIMLPRVWPCAVAAACLQPGCIAFSR